MNIKTLLNRFVVIVAVVGLVLGAIAAPAHAFDESDLDRLLSSSSKDCSGCDLSGANLSGKDLTSAFLLEANLKGANLQGAILLGAMLQVANLRGANLRGANLKGADLLGAMLQGATLPDGRMYPLSEPYGMVAPLILSRYGVAPIR